MKFLLDANAWIGHLRQTCPTVTQRLSQHPPTDVVLCSVVLAELLYGAENSGPAHRASNLALVAGLRQQFASIPFDDVAAGTPIGPNDVMIASIALASGLTLVTRNTAEFSRVPGLTLEDWQVP